jgi:hypothetical protein
MSLGSDDMPAPGLVSLSSDNEILARVEHFLDANPPAGRTLVIQFLDADDRELPVIVPIDGIPRQPDGPTVTNLCWIIAQVLGEHAPGGSAVLTLTRPGDGAIGPDDRIWHDAITTAAAAADVSIRLICLGTRDGVRVLPE